EGDGQDMAWLLAPTLAGVSDAVRDRPGLASARPGQHADRPVERRSDEPLFGVERGEPFSRSHTSEGDERTDTRRRDGTVAIALRDTAGAASQRRDLGLALGSHARC